MAPRHPGRGWVQVEDLLFLAGLNTLSDYVTDSIPVKLEYP